MMAARSWLTMGVLHIAIAFDDAKDHHLARLLPPCLPCLAPANVFAAFKRPGRQLAQLFLLNAVVGLGQLLKTFARFRAVKYRCVAYEPARLGRNNSSKRGLSPAAQRYRVPH